ncbi:glycosyltransferase [Candidatus Pelagibacter sp.]|nr:glycosyltransferase [Candidatus Pelagibacter sp.]
MVKVLHVNFSDLNGGAAIGVNRLHQALIKRGEKSKVLVVEKTGNDSNVVGPSNTIEILITQLKVSLSRFVKRKLIKTNNVETFSFNFFNTNILKKINKFDAEIIHIHWIGNEMLSISQLKKINKPVIWTFWDMWPMCGAEHHSYDNRFVEGYNKNNRPKQESLFDLNRFIWNYKKKHLNFDFHIIALSKWMSEKIKKSFLFSEKEVTYLPLHINTNKWKKIDKIFSRNIFNLDQNKKILLFGSSTSTNHRKGFDFLFKLFKQQNFENCKLVIFGEKPKNLNDLNIDYEYVGRIKDNYSLSILYSAADIVLMPSKIEVFGQVGLEANSCGTPCIVFENTGPTDYTKHKENGYVSKYLDIRDYANGINWILDDENRYKELSNNCIENVKKNYNDELIVEKFIQKYLDLLKK